MSTIVFCPLPQLGHILPTFGIARGLRSLGHRVVYWVENEVRDVVVGAGFEHEAFLACEDVAEPKGELTPDQQQEAWDKHIDAMWRELRSGRLTQQLKSLEADVLIGDLCRAIATLIAHDAGVPFARCSTSLSARFEPDRPPLWSSAVQGELSIREVERLWMYEIGMTSEEDIARDKAASRREVLKFAESCGLHVSQIEERVTFAFFIVASDPEMVMCSKAFDFPLEERPGQVYVGPCLPDIEASEWSCDARRPDVPLVYCSFGSQALRYPKLKKFLRTLLKAMESRPDVDMLVAAPKEVWADLEVPKNVTHQEWVPQREVLKEASLCILHGGLGSVKEAIWEGVPMLLCPQAFDQHGNAARVEFHSLGKRVLPDEPHSAEAIGEAIDALLEDPAYRDACTRMQERFREDAQTTTAIDFIAAVIERKLPVATAAQFREQTHRARMALGGDDD